MLGFSKLQGTGNDFIIIDNMDGKFEDFIGATDLPLAVKLLCRRRLGVGADGLILVEPSKIADFKWQFFNSDGSTANMCGNGARCVARFAFKKGITRPEMRFETNVGIVKAVVDGSIVKVSLPKPRILNENLNIEGIDGTLVDAGVPHFVVFVDDLEGINVNGIGRKIRISRILMPEGANVDFVKLESNGISIRTYERGVESETLACGTGSVASALVASRKFDLKSPIKVSVKSGESLTVFIDDSVFLEGPTTWVYEGYITHESLR